MFLQLPAGKAEPGCLSVIINLHFHSWPDSSSGLGQAWALGNRQAWRGRGACSHLLTGYLWEGRFLGPSWRSQPCPHYHQAPQSHHPGPPLFPLNAASLPFHLGNSYPPFKAQLKAHPGLFNSVQLWEGWMKLLGTLRSLGAAATAREAGVAMLRCTEPTAEHRAGTLDLLTVCGARAGH